MSRARNLKPGFFKNELLAECPPLARILFQGLWCEADREGRLEDRPKRLKAEYLPYDDCDADALLNELVARGFIVRYERDGGRYIAVLAFAKHQNPHVREPASAIPAPDKHSASTVPAPDKHSSGPALSPFPFPDSKELPPTAERDAPAADSPPPDPIWGTGLAWLERKGVPNPQARTILGKVRQCCGDAETALLLAQAEADDVSDPGRWLLACAAKRTQSGGGARAGPAPPASRTRTALETLQGMTSDANRLDQRRNTQRPEQAALPEP